MVRFLPYFDILNNDVDRQPNLDEEVLDCVIDAVEPEPDALAAARVLLSELNNALDDVYGSIAELTHLAQHPDISSDRVLAAAIAELDTTTFVGIEDVAGRIGDRLWCRSSAEDGLP